MCNKNSIGESITLLRNAIIKRKEEKENLENQIVEISLKVDEIDTLIKAYQSSILLLEEETQTINSGDLLREHTVNRQNENVQDTSKKRRGEFIVLNEIKKSIRGISQKQIKEITGYSESTIKTYVRSLLESEFIKQEGELYYYIKGMEGIDIGLLEKKTAFTSIVEDIIHKSEEPMSAQDILKSLEKSGHDFSEIVSPINKISTAIGKLKKAEKPTIKFSHKVGKVPYYCKNSNDNEWIHGV